MLKKTIAYVDFDDKERTEEFYFNLSKSELIEMQLSVDGGMAEWLEKIVESEKAGEMLNVMKKMILSSVGIKSDDGKRFVKSEQITQDFASSAAFDALFMEVATDADKAVQFVKGIIPQELSAEIEEDRKNSVIDNISESAEVQEVLPSDK